jgi:hypothetical protein
MSIAKSHVPSLLAVFLLAFSSRVNAGGKGELPTDLDSVPRNAVGFLHVRVADLWRSDLATELRYLVDKAGPDAWKDIEKRSPINPALLDRLTIVMLTPSEPFPSAEPDARSALFIVSTSKPFERWPLIEALGPKEKVYRDQLYYFNEDLWSGLAIIDERTFVIGSEASLIRYFNMRRRNDRTGPLQAPLRAAAGKHSLVIGLNPTTLPQEGGLPPAAGTLLSAYSGTITLDLEPMLRFQARLDFQDEAKAKEGQEAAKQLLELGREGLKFPIAELEKILKDPEKGSISELPKHFAALVGLGFLREVDAQLKSAPLQRDGVSVKLPLEYKSHAAMPALVSIYGSVFAVGVSARSTFKTVGEKFDGKEDPVETHLRSLAKAMEDYRKKHGVYPPAALHDKDGRPTLSWRVALLPYLGEESLYKEFKLDEPWDSLHNQQLIKKLPKALRVEERDKYYYYYDRSAQWKTTTQVITGANTLFDGPKGIAGPDKERKTILLTRLSTQGVYWTKPADVDYAADKPLPSFHGKYQDRMQVLLTDGTYRAIDRSMNEKDIRTLIERSDKPMAVKAPQLDDLESIWNDLTRHDDAGTKKAWQGIAAMSKMPARAVPFLKARVKATPAVDAKLIAQLLIEIDNNVFRTRTLAQAKLEELGELAHAAIEKKLAEKSHTLETTRLLQGLADKSRTTLTGDELRRLRAVEILGLMGTPEARAVLADLARGADGVVLTEQARKALARLTSRNGPE